MKLVAPNFEPKVRQMLEQILQEHQNCQKDNKGKPYIVSDWDNTAIIFDSQQNLFLYQVEHLQYRLTPARFAELIAKDLTAEQYVVLQALLERISQLYTTIYDNYCEMAGMKSREEIREMPEFEEFRQAMACLYKYPLHHLTECCRILYLFEGYTTAEVKALTEQCIAEEKTGMPRLEKFSFAVEGQEFRGEFLRGLKFLPEQEEFFEKCQEQGIAVYICSASHQSVVEVHAGQYGIPAENVFALVLKEDDSGKILAEMEASRPFTVGDGKAETIRQILLPRHEREPLLVMGDSMGDFAMMRDFSANIVLVNTKAFSQVQQALREVGKTAKVWIQGRDEVEAVWIENSDCRRLTM